MENPISLESHRIERYRNFATLYEIKESNFDTFVGLYDIDDLLSFMPQTPSTKEKQILNELIGVTGVEGYLDHRKAHNTFELIMLWREQTGNWDLDVFRLKR